MTEPTSLPTPRVARPAPYAGLFDGAFDPCTDLPDAMRALLEALAIREQAPAESTSTVARR